MSGFWSAFGRASSVDWCEPNYLHSSYVAEWWNTWSSLPIALAGLAGLLLLRRLPWPTEPRFLLGYASVLIVGLGSTAFHGTLLEYPQALDELPMIYTGLIFLYILRFRDAEVSPGSAERTKMRTWRLVLLGYALAFSAAYFLLRGAFVFFIVSYALIVSYLSLTTGRLSLGAGSDPTQRRLFFWSAGSYVGGVLLLWVPEHLLLVCDHPIQRLELHAWFHLSSAVGAYTWVLWAHHARQRRLGRSVRIGGLIPSVRPA